MSALCCYRCGCSLAELSLPLSRLDECPQCRAQLHVCRMCTHYAPRLARRCDEDDAPEGRDSETANFCDYFTPSPLAFDPTHADADAAARAELEKLFGAEGGSAPRDGTQREASDEERARRDAEALFKR